jgi:replicative DNA helicase
MGECLAKFKGDAEMFYDLRHQTIYNAVQEMYDKREAIDLITLQQRLKDAQMLDQVGGIPYLTSLQDAIPSAANLSYYLDIVQEKRVLRSMIRTCSDIVGRAYENEGEVDTLMDEAEKEILKISDSRVQTSTPGMKELVRKAISSIEDYHQRQGMLTGLGTGFPDLDKMTSGLHEGEMVVIAARPSMGKTSLAMNIAEHVVIEQKLPVGVFSLEMSAESLVLRMLCSRSRVNLRNVREGFLAERDFPKLTGAASKMAACPLIIDDSSGLSILQLRAKARRMHQQHQIKLLVIDYLQLLHSTARRAQENRQQEIADISSGIKSLAKELKIPVIVLSQLNRELEKDKNRKPRLSDLRESGSIEQDADLVGLLYKPSADDEETAGEDQDSRPVNLLIAKQRNGPTGDVNLTFLKSITRFETAAKVSDEDVPG